MQRKSRDGHQLKGVSPTPPHEFRGRGPPLMRLVIEDFRGFMPRHFGKGYGYPLEREQYLPPPPQHYPGYES